MANTDTYTASTGEQTKPSGWSVDDPSGGMAPQSVLRRGMGLIEQREQAGREQEQALAKKQEAESPYQQKLKGILDSPVTAHVELQKMKEAPKPEDYKKYTMEFLGAMALVGMFAGRGSRRAGNASLKAFTGAMEGWQQGNLEAYAQATKQWEENSKAVIENNRVELQKYQEIINNRALNIEQMKAALMLAGMESGNQAMVAQARAGNFDALLKNVDGLARTTAQLQGAVDPLMLYNKQNAEMYAAAANDLNKHPERLANVKYEDFVRLKAQSEAFRKYDPSLPELRDPGQEAQFAQPAGMRGRNPEDAKQIVQAMKNGDQPPTTTGLYGMGPMVKAEAERQGVNLAQLQLEWDAAKKQILSLNGPQMTRFVGLARGVQNTIDRVKELAEQMKLSGVPALNRLELQTYIQTQGNSPNGRLATKYMTDVNTLKEEFANLANGGYAPTEPAWKLADQQINGNYGVYQLSDSLDEVKRLIGYRLHSIPGMDKLGPGAANRYTGETGAPTLPSEGGAPAKGDSGWGELRVH